MHREEVTPAQYQWLLEEHYKNDRSELDGDLQHDLAYVIELLRFCPSTLFAVDPFVPPFRPQGFVETPHSTYQEEELRKLERRQVPLRRLICTQWKVYRDAVSYYYHALKQNGVVAPVLVYYDASTDNYYVKDGHHRLFAYFMMGIDLVDVALSETGMPQANKFFAVHEMEVTER